MKNTKIFIDNDSLFIYKFKNNNNVCVTSVEDSEDGYTVKSMCLSTSLTGQKLEDFIVESFANHKPEIKATELEGKEVYDVVEDIGIMPNTDLLKPFILPQKKQTPVESVLEQIMQLSYKERSDVLVALLDMM